VFQIKFLRSAKRTCQLHAIPLTLSQSRFRHRPHIHTHFDLAIANGNVQILHNAHHHRARNAFALESYWWATLRNYFWQKIMRNTADALLHGFVFVSACLYIYCKNSFISSMYIYERITSSSSDQTSTNSFNCKSDARTSMVNKRQGRKDEGRVACFFFNNNGSEAVERGRSGRLAERNKEE
jgi:hypothetical protein